MKMAASALESFSSNDIDRKLWSAYLGTLYELYSINWFHYFCFSLYAHDTQGNMLQQILSFHFIVEIMTTVPFILGVSDG